MADFQDLFGLQPYEIEEDNTWTLRVPEACAKLECPNRGDFAKSLPKEFLAEVRALGFPYYKYDESYQDLWEKFKMFNAFSMESNNIIKQSGLYSKLASVFFPHMFEVQIPGKVTPMHSWQNDKQLGLAIELATERGQFPLKASMLRSVLKFVNGSQCVSNFRPEVAKYLYDRYGRKGKIYDYSMGWGGRMLGFLASTAIEYVGVDVNTANFPSYDKILKTYEPNFEKIVTPIVSPAENYHAKKEYFDFAFSSPPYFNKEQYSDDVNQSFNQYNTCDAWVQGFLIPVIRNVYYMLKFDGVFAMNIADIKDKGKEHPLLQLSKDKAAENGFVMVDELIYDLPRVPGKGTARKPETVSIFVKKAYKNHSSYDESRWKQREPNLDEFF